MKTIALIDDDKSIQELFSAYLCKMGYDCRVYDNPVDFTKDLKQHARSFDLAITDINMPKVSGLELIPWLNRYHPQMCTIALTAHDAKDIESIAYQGGACLFLKKPLKLERLHRIIRLLSQKGLSGEVFHVTLIDCLQTLACDSEARVLKVQENGHSHLLVALQHNQVQGLLYEAEGKHVQGVEALAKLVCIGDATFSELHAEHYNDLIAQNLNIPLPQVALHIAQYQDESPTPAIKAQTLSIAGPTAQKKLLSQILSNMGFEISEQPEACHAHIVMQATPEALQRINDYPKPTLIAQHDMPLMGSSLAPGNPHSIQAQALQSVGEWAAYIKSHFIRGLSGTLNKISVFQLIQLVSQASTTGCILIKDLIKQQESTLYFIQGKLIEATSNKAVGETALFESMRIRMGCFQQIPFQDPPSRQLEGTSVTRLLMNYSRPFELEDPFVKKIDSLISA